jgi:NAD(P)-dependent dehydrogenase (short-subunit alcohol dehydrogenase family)
MQDSVDFGGRVVIVTGAGGGLGRAHARLLAARGARVVVNDVRNAAGVVAELAAAGGTAVADAHDIGTDEGARALIQTAAGAFGGVDALVNNAGIFPVCPFAEMTWEMFDRVQRVHAYGPFFATRYAWPYLIKSGHGRVVMTGAKAAIWGETPDLTHYGTAKGAIFGMTRQLAREGAPHGIAVNAILPSALTGPGHPRARELAERMGVDPGDRDATAERSTELAAAVVAWLCHPGCTANGEFIRARTGEVRRLSFTLSVGINDPAGLTVERVRDNFAAIMDWAGATILPAIIDS